MSNKYTYEDVEYLIPEPTTPEVQAAIVRYINEGFVPPADPCLSCTPNLIRRYISRIQVAERDGTWPLKQKPHTVTSETLENLGKSILEIDETVEVPAPRTRRKPKAD